MLLPGHVLCCECYRLHSVTQTYSIKTSQCECRFQRNRWDKDGCFQDTTQVQVPVLCVQHPQCDMDTTAKPDHSNPHTEVCESLAASWPISMLNMITVPRIQLRYMGCGLCVIYNFTAQDGHKEQNLTTATCVLRCVKVK